MPSLRLRGEDTEDAANAPQKINNTNTYKREENYASSMSDPMSDAGALL